MNDFYIGYELRAPYSLARFLRRVVSGFGVLAVAVPLVLLRGQAPFPSSAFEFGTVRSFTGTLIGSPYPALLVARPGNAGQNYGYSSYLLVAPGKHGAENLVRGFEGKPVRLQGQLIYRENQTLIEVVPSSIAVADTAAAPQAPVRDLGPVVLSGEIVDSKCYVGVMNPGSGKVHRDCAVRCISGGIPPIFVASDGRSQFLMVDAEGKAVARAAILPFVAEPLTVHGELLQTGETRSLKIDPATLVHTR